MYTDILNKLDQLLVLQQKLLGQFASLKEGIPAEEWLDNADVKQLLKISDSSLYRLRKTKVLPAKRMAGKWYYQRSVLDSLISSK